MVQWLSAQSRGCTAIPNTQPRMFSSSQPGTRSLLNSNPPYPPPAQPLQSTLLLPVSRKLPALCTSPKWDPTARVLLCLVYFTEHHVLQVRRGCSPCGDFLLFLRLNIMHCADGVHFVYLFIWSMDVELPLLFSCRAFITSAFVNAGVQTQSGFSQYV